jgi:tRNA A-37 threonylcarbamoyl transferase component Bud32
MSSDQPSGVSLPLPPPLPPLPLLTNIINNNNTLTLPTSITTTKPSIQRQASTIIEPQQQQPSRLSSSPPEPDSNNNNNNNNNNDSEDNTDTNLYQVLYDYKANHEDEISLARGNTLKLISRSTGDEGWWHGFNLSDGKRGIFPANYVQAIVLSSVKRDPPPHIPYTALEFKECIGSGGFGKVYKGFWRRADHDDKIEMVAIKKARVEGDRDDLMNSIRESVMQEATLFWTLRHPNIIQLIGVCFQEPHFCLVMEYAKGGSLGRLLSVRKNGFPPYILIKWAMQVAQCMLYLHEQASPYRIPIIHRDLKSSNILLSEDATSGEHRLADIQLKLTDFGLARELNKTTNELSAAGTYSHMPPEVIKSSNYSKVSSFCPL